MTVIDVIIFVDNQINECGYQEESGSSENIDSMCSFIPEEHPNRHILILAGLGRIAGFLQITKRHKERAWVLEKMKVLMAGMK